VTTEPSETAAAGRSGLINRVLGGRYEVLEMLGEGPLLIAYRARDRAQNRIVTIKTLRPAFAEHREIVEALKTGLGQTLSLTHNSISRTYDVGTDEETGAVYIAEEYVRGIDLKERIRRAAPFQLSAATETAIAIAEALEFAHERGIAHGDVRPQNILIGPEGQVKLTNFGVAVAQTKAISDVPIALKRIVGYIAPDAARATAPTSSADLYGLGVILFEMLTGDVPYTGDNAIQIALKHAQDPVPSPRQVNTGVPVALDGLVRKVLAKQPADRYSSAAEMLRDLKTIRDALRYGRSLSWSPLEQGSSTTPAASNGATVAATDEPTIATPLPASTVSALPVGGTTAGGANGIVAPAVTGNASVPAQTSVIASESLNTPGSTTPTGGGRTLASAEVVMPRRTDTGNDAGSSVMPVAGRAAKSGAAVKESMDDDSPPVRATGSRWLAFINLFLALLLVGAVGYLIVMAANFLKPIGEVVVPNLVGKRLADAKTMAIEQKFELKIVDEEFRDKEPNGTIFKQGENPGSKVKQGKPIPIWVSKGPRMVDVPDVRDMTFDKARRVLESKGLRLGNYRGEYDPLTPKGTVLRQLPEAGENRARGTKIDLIISRGEEPAAPTPDPYAQASPEPETTPDPDATPTPDAEPTPEASPTPEGEKARARYFHIRYPVPDDGERHKIRIDVLDDDGPRTVFNRSRKAGGEVEYDVEARGSQISIKVYDNDELRSELKK
jgi:eukaryotic-like serine/threonine-protein kinase